MNSHNFINKNSINIFTDASLISIDNNNHTCAGYCIYIGSILIEQNYQILYNSTVNQGELYAIYMGVNAASKYKNNYKLRLFSDSQTSIFAIRDRIFKWIHCIDRYGNIYNCSKTPISNQEYVIDIIRSIMYYNIHIEFYHIKGHVNINNYESLENAKRVFKESNYIKENIDKNLIIYLAKGNDQIDQYTGYMIQLNLDFIKKMKDKTYRLFYTNSNDINYNQYKYLIKEK